MSPRGIEHTLENATNGGCRPQAPSSNAQSSLSLRSNVHIRPAVQPSSAGIAGWATATQLGARIRAVLSTVARVQISYCEQMTHQILLVGDDHFSTLISREVRGLETLAVKFSSSVGHAERQMLTITPDLVIGQAGLFHHYSITQQYRQHQQLTGIYVVLVEDCPNWQSGEVFIPLQRTASALELGADAYVWLAKDENQSMTRRLLQLQVKRGLERARIHRDLQRANSWLSAIALIDSLTQLHNRRALDIELPQ